MAQSGNSSLLAETTGIPDLRNASIVLVKTEWNRFIVDELEKGCLARLQGAGVKNIRSLVVPGAFEIPFSVKAYWDHCRPKKRPEAFIALGCVLRGDTPHFDYVCRAVTDGVLQLNLGLPVPTIFGVLTVDTEEQARERIGGRHGHKGEEAAMTALKMIALTRQFS